MICLSALCNVVPVAAIIASHQVDLAIVNEGRQVGRGIRHVGGQGRPAQGLGVEDIHLLHLRLSLDSTQAALYMQ